MCIQYMLLYYNLLLFHLQAKNSVTQTFGNYVVAEYGKHSLTDETVDFVQASVSISNVSVP